MSEYLSLAIVFVILYVIECVHLVPPQTILLRSIGFNRCSVRAAGEQFLVGGKSIALTTLFAPWGQNYFLASEIGVYDTISPESESRIREHWKSFVRRTYLLRAVCTLLYMLLTLFLAQAIYPMFQTNVLFMMLVLLVASLTTISISSFLLLRSFYPERRTMRWGTAIKCLFYPPSAVRIIDQMSAILFQGENPIEVAACLGKTDELAPILARQIRELRYPITGESTEPDAVRRETLKRLESLSNHYQIPIATYLRPNEIDSREGTHFCPRCLQVYEKDSEPCADCPGVLKVTL